MKDNKYIPQPIDTSTIELPEDVLDFTEVLSKNIHEVWAKQRIDDGWEYGEKRNDRLKQHPGIIPYEELSEAEKVYDRNTAMETLKVISKLGFTIKE